jgi:hypothetical protein
VAAWTRAFLGAPLPGSTLTAEERSELNQLLLRAKENGDEEALNRLMELANDPIEFRRVMASFQGEKE